MNTLFKTVIGGAAQAKPDGNIIPMQQTKEDIQKIFIRDFTIEMFIGVMPQEHDAKQRVIVNADVSVSTNNNWRADEMDNVLSYVDVMDDIRMIASKGHIKLVETFAEMIAEKCLQYSEAQSVTISIEKPDIISEVHSVGVQITRTKA